MFVNQRSWYTHSCSVGGEMSDETKAPNQYPQYKIEYAQTALTYEDGFADGYSRAWKECWEHMRQLAQAEEKLNNQETKETT